MIQTKKKENTARKKSACYIKRVLTNYSKYENYSLKQDIKKYNEN